MRLLDHFLRSWKAGAEEPSPAKPEPAASEIRSPDDAASNEQAPSLAASSAASGKATATGGTGALEPTPEPAPELVVLLEEVLPRVPTQRLRAGLHDPRRELRFAVEELSAGIARGQVEVRLSQLAQMCPDVFEAPPSGESDPVIRLPLQKLLQQLARIRTKPLPSVPHLPGAPLVFSSEDPVFTGKPPSQSPAARAGRKLVGVPRPAAELSPPPASPAPEAPAPSPQPAQTETAAPDPELPVPISFAPPPPAMGLAEDMDPGAVPPDAAPSDAMAAPPGSVESPPPIADFSPDCDDAVAVPPRDKIHLSSPSLAAPVVPAAAALPASAGPAGEIVRAALRIPPGIAVVKPPVVHAQREATGFALPTRDSAAAPAADPSAPSSRNNLRLPPLFGNGAVAPALQLPAPPVSAGPAATRDPAVPRSARDAAPPAGGAGFDQGAMQTLFHTDEPLDLPGICRLAAAFPGVHGCLFLAEGVALRGGAWPAALDAETVRALRDALAAATAAFPEKLPGVQAITLHSGAVSLSFFDRAPVCLCVVHAARGFLPGVREKFTLLAEKLSAGFRDASL